MIRDKLVLLTVSVDAKEEYYEFTYEESKSLVTISFLGEGVSHSCPFPRQIQHSIQYRVYNTIQYGILCLEKDYISMFSATHRILVSLKIQSAPSYLVENYCLYYFRAQ